LASAQQELIQQQGYLNQTQQQLVQQQLVETAPTLSLTEGPATGQVLSQMLAKASAHTPDELCRLLRDRSANEATLLLPPANSTDFSPSFVQFRCFCPKEQKLSWQSNDFKMNGSGYFYRLQMFAVKVFKTQDCSHFCI